MDSFSMWYILRVRTNEQSRPSRQRRNGARRSIRPKVDPAQLLKNLNERHPITVFKSSTSQHTESEDSLDFSSAVCAICLEVMTDTTEIHDLTCAHAFHKECLEDWVSREHIHCPVCRDNLCRGPHKAEEMTEAEKSQA
ncbi:hypothetical protein BX600DRAFT_69091 [Xylariales sp. PMI_506]|nr:hypothetical protein BX600DRAFT_69091 [Xylariales sp. PMI_506]